MARGTLRVYLGAAPGVGKTYAMLDEGVRRLHRGTDVMVGLVETYGRPHTEERIADLPVLPRRTVRYRGAEFTELDTEAVLARRPELVLVDELAHTNVPGSGPNAKRWQDVEALLDAGIDVLSTVNIQHLESLNDVVEQITGIRQRETVPDSVVRAAEQVQLVDSTPEALRRRMAHGNIYPSEKVDAALANYFRPGNLTALRELALLWLADRVEEGLQRYREQHGITATWETRERVVVGLTGGPEGTTLIRRAARIAARSNGELMAVHVARSDGLVGASVKELTEQRALLESLGGSYHSVVGDNVPRALLDFARSVDATQIVLGASRRRPWLAALAGPGTGATTIAHSAAIDVHMISHDYAGRGPTVPPLGRGLTPRRRLAGALVAALLLAILTPALATARGTLDLAVDVSLYLLVVIVTSLVGGFYPALGSAIVGSLLLNYFFAPPLHTFTIARTANVAALVVFVITAALVSQVVDLAARRSQQASRAAAEAEALSMFATGLLGGDDVVHALLDRVRETFGMRSVSLLRRDTGGRPCELLASAGPDPALRPADGDASATIDEHRVLVLTGRPMPAADQRMLASFAAQVAVAYDQQQLAAAARAAEPLAESDRQRAALLNAVSHDLRTPIATAKTAISSLRASDVGWSETERAELLGTADVELDRLTELVTNLLDMSRLRAGALPVLTAPIGLDDVVPRAVEQAAPGTAVDIDIPVDLPEVLADAGLLERVVANLVQNAVRYSPGQVRIAGSALGDRVELRVIDRGPGIDTAEAEAVFEPFQRRGDSTLHGGGVGLGLAIARGLTEAMAGTVTVEDTPGGGATLVVSLPVAKEAP
ncbi:MAG: sensor histidine kinase KdpD [Actinobacteria bacterium]|nr:sensor histidine kinase KdpD [Actinomycetota bacterium]